MSTAYAILAASSAIGIAHSVFFAASLWSLRKGNILANRLLALLLLAFALRISKSVIHFAFSGTPDLFPATALAGQSALGPLLWLYLRALLHAQSKLKNADYLHFIPFLLLVVAIPFHTNFTIENAYRLIILQLFIYLIFSFHYIKYKMRVQDAQRAHWIRYLLGGVALIAFVYFMQLFAPPIPWYAASTFLAAMLLYGLSFWALRHYHLFVNGILIPKKAPLETEEAEQLYRRIITALEQELLYKDAGLTVAKLAKHLHVQPYLLSKVINDQFNKSFPELLNYYRIQEAARQLSDPKTADLTIQAIAYQCGFNALSSFYTAFKNEYQLTPAQFRSQFAAIKS